MYEPIKTGVFRMEKRLNKVGIRLTDEHMSKLTEYCELTAASPSGVINTLAESYIQAMIDSGKIISPSIKNFKYKELLMVAEENDQPHKAKKTPRKGAA